MAIDWLLLTEPQRLAHAGEHDRFCLDCGNQYIPRNADIVHVTPRPLCCGRVTVNLETYRYRGIKPIPGYSPPNLIKPKRWLDL